MTQRRLILSTGAFWGRHLLACLEQRRKHPLALFFNQFDAAFTARLGAVTLESLELPTARYAAALGRKRSVEACADTSTYPPWVAPETSAEIARRARFYIPHVLELIERIKALHSRTPIGALMVYHDLNMYETTALAVARHLGIPSMHVLHASFCGLVDSGQPHNAEYADIVCVWSDQCAADFRPVGKYRERMAVVGSPELDKFHALRTPDGKSAARERLGLAPDIPVVGYASSYEDDNAVWSADKPGATWAAFRSFLRVYREAFAGDRVQLVVKLHPSSPEVEKHQAILDEEGVTASVLVGRDDGASVAACDLLVSLFPSGVMLDALMSGTLSLWVKTYNSTFPIYRDAPWLPRCSPDEFTADVLRRALLDAAYRDNFLKYFDAQRVIYNRGADGKATERVLDLVDRMVSVVATPDNPWGAHYHRRLDALRSEQAMLERLLTLSETR